MNWTYDFMVFLLTYGSMFKQRQPASSKNGSMVITVEGSQSGRLLPMSNSTSWTKLVLDMYQPGTSVRYANTTYVFSFKILCLYKLMDIILIFHG